MRRLVEIVREFSQLSFAASCLICLLPSAAVADLVHHFRLDESGGLTALDSVRGRSGVLLNFENNDDTQWVAGQFDGALDFGADATANNTVQIELSGVSAAATGGFTVAMWVNPGEGIATTGEWQLLATPGDVIGFSIINATVEGHHFDRNLLFWDSNLPNLAVGTTSLEPGTWYHVAITSTGVGGAKEYYINGVQETKMQFVPSQGGTDQGNVDGWGPGVGSFGALPNGARAHDSIIDDVRIYDEVLDAAALADVVANSAPGALQVTNLLPSDGTGFYDPGGGVSFTASTPNVGAVIAGADIDVVVNGVDVSAELTISGPDTARDVLYDGLVSDTVYAVAIRVRDSAGGIAIREISFDTLSPSSEPGLRHRWRLDETTGLTAADSVSGSHGQLNNFEANDDQQWVAAQVAGGMDLGADATVNNFVSATLPAMSAAETGGFTVSMWIRPGAQIQTNGEYQLFAAPGGGIGFTILNATIEGHHFDRNLLFWDSNVANLALGTTSLEPDVWYHIAITSTGVGGEKEYYLNGRLESQRLLVPSQGGTPQGNLDGWPAGVATFGALSNGGRAHDSVLDDVRVYERPLSEAEVLQIATLGLRHHWRFDETEGLLAIDSASGNHGQLTNFDANDDLQWVVGQSLGGLDLGTDDTVNNLVSATVPAMSAAESGGFTIAMWVRPGPEILTGGEYQLVATPGDSIGFTILNATVEGHHFDRNLLFWDSNLPNLALGTTSLEPGTWYHVAISSTGVGGVKEYYINGVREEKMLLVPSQGGTDQGNVDGWPAGAVSIGALPNGARAHTSVLDDVRIYDSVLTAEELSAFQPPTLVLPGDCDLSGERDLRDLVCFVLQLFPGFVLQEAARPSLPCATGDLSAPSRGNLTVLDMTGNGSIDVGDIVALANLVFLNGQPPTQGCVAVPAFDRCSGSLTCE